MTSTTVRLDDLFTAAELNKALDLWEACQKHHLRFHARCRDEIVKPAMPRINQSTGQENDPDYWTYAIEFAITQTGG